MKKYCRILSYELIACSRQVREIIKNTRIASIILASFFITLCIVQTVYKAAKINVGIINNTVLVLTAILGTILVDAYNIKEILHSEKGRSLACCPINIAAYRYIKITKVQFPFFVFYVLFIGMNVLADWLTGNRLITSIGNNIILIWCYLIWNALRITIEITKNISKVKQKITSAVRVLIYVALTVAIHIFINCNKVIELCAKYDTAPIRALGAILLLAIIHKEIYSLLKNNYIMESDIKTNRIKKKNNTIELFKNNYVARKDLLEITSNSIAKKHIIGNMIFSTIVPIVIAIVSSIYKDKIGVTNRMMFVFVQLGCSSSLLSVFKRQLTMGYEGNYIIYYALCGTPISTIQLLRTNYICILTVPIFSIISLIVAGILRLSISIAFCFSLILIIYYISMLHIDAYYLIKRTSYYNEINIPSISQGVIRAVIRTLISFTVLTMPLLYELKNYTTAISKSTIWGGGIFSIITSFITIVVYRKLLHNNNKLFYGELQNAM